MREEEKREGNVFVGGGMMSGGELLVAWKLNDLDCSLQSIQGHI